MAAAVAAATDREPATLMIIRLRNVPATLHRRLREWATSAGLPPADFLLRELRKITERPTPEEIRERLRRRDNRDGTSDSLRNGSDTE